MENEIRYDSRSEMIRSREYNLKLEAYKENLKSLREDIEAASAELKKISSAFNI